MSKQRKQRIYDYNKKGEKIRKECPKCKERKPMAEFMSKDLKSRYSRCKSCRKGTKEEEEAPIKAARGTVPLCKNCRNFNDNLDPNMEPICACIFRNLVFGDFVDYLPCDKARSIEAYCGTLGEFFEEAPYDHKLCPICKGKCKMSSVEHRGANLFAVECESCRIKHGELKETTIEAWKAWDEWHGGLFK
jgi:hypothetical protein